MKRRYKSSDYELFKDNSVKIGVMIIPMHSVTLHYADDAIIVARGRLGDYIDCT
ncbi:MAG TPA: hypothetical protein VJL79_04890 [Nitrososphaera sp.]|nr:hypothetical protein [Nitrososphaera sp.]